MVHSYNIYFVLFLVCVCVFFFFKMNFLFLMPQQYSKGLDQHGVSAILSWINNHMWLYNSYTS